MKKPSKWRKEILERASIPKESVAQGTAESQSSEKTSSNQIGIEKSINDIIADARRENNEERDIDSVKPANYEGFQDSATGRPVTSRKFWKKDVHVNLEPEKKSPVGQAGIPAFEFGGVVKLGQRPLTERNVFVFVGFVGTVLFFPCGFLICFGALKRICTFFDDEQSNTMQAGMLAVLVVFIGAIALRLLPKPRRLKTNPIMVEIQEGIDVVFGLVAGIFAIGTVAAVLIGILFSLYGIISDFGSHSKPAENAPSYISDANKGYMTRQDDELLTATALKKDMGQNLTKQEQDYLDSAKAGKIGKL
jgi:hypothetical protein